MSGNYELILGASAIASALNLPRRKVYHLIEIGALPVVRLGNAVAIRKAKLADWLESLEAAA